MRYATALRVIKGLAASGVADTSLWTLAVLEYRPVELAFGRTVLTAPEALLTGD